MRRYLLDFFQNLRFKHKLVLSYLFVVFVPIALLGTSYFLSARKALEDQARMSISAELDLMADNMRYKISRYNDMLEVILFDPRIQSLFEKDNPYELFSSLAFELNNYVKPLFSVLLSLNPEAEHMVFYNENNIPGYDSIIRSSETVRDSSFYESAYKKMVWYQENGYLYCARALVSMRNFKRAGVLSIQLNPAKFFGGGSRPVKRDYGLYILEENGDVLFTAVQFSDPSMMRGADRLSEVSDGIATLEGTRYLILRKTIPEAHWEIIYYVPAMQLTDRAGDIIPVTMSIILGCVILVILLIRLFSNTIESKIHGLNEQMKAFRQANMDIEISSKYRDEIGELTNTFGAMIRQINGLVDEVSQSRLIQKEAEIKALQAQINPHFLYNVLSLIRWKARMIYAYDISHIADSVSAFYRTALNRGENIIRIQEELLNTKAYIHIQSVMHHNSFDVEYAFDEKLDDYSMLNLILQPIVENAIEHGIERKRQGRGFLKISGKVLTDRIEFIVSDNGPGLSPKKLETLFVKQTGGYGLRNVQERLVLFFGKGYGLSLAPYEKEPDNPEEPGAAVRVTIPLFSVPETAPGQTLCAQEWEESGGSRCSVKSDA